MRFFPVSDKNTKEKRIVVWIMAKNTRYERVSAVDVVMMGRGKWSTKDYEILARWFKLRREIEERCFTAGPKGDSARSLLREGASRGLSSRGFVSPPFRYVGRRMLQTEVI
ncbi:hypothetical protein AVEN_227809-1 [Araneus ventricosus]|uniref:Uncharacterized protein n=1 Tax=Araneus ventricosus TaxID=182803 RepID=A0A4Y2IS69_ARAVE|nr:hypothetical protein AVEN_227809-1 [Araneus ventricosus]